MKLSRPVRLLGYISGSLATVALLGWAYLYADSIHQRHRAEALIADLKKFPFQSATFTTVREFTLSHGGSPIRDGSRGANWRSVNGSDPNCNPQDCSFEIYIDNQAQELTTTPRAYGFFHLLGVQPWGVIASFAVRDAKLLDSRIQIETVVSRQIRGTDCLVALLYQTVSRPPSESFAPSPYAVYRPHITSNGPADALQTRFLSTDSAPARAFDIDLHCLTAVTSTCTQSQLAPSAWADYHRLRY